MATLLLIENEGALFRGYDRGFPLDIWNPDIQKWEAYKGDVPKPMEWGHVVGQQEAQEYKQAMTSK